MVTVLGNTLIVYFFTCEIVFYYDLMLRYVCEFFEVPQRQVCCDSTFHCYFEYISFVLVWRLVSYFTWFINGYAVGTVRLGQLLVLGSKRNLNFTAFRGSFSNFCFLLREQVKTSYQFVSGFLLSLGHYGIKLVYNRGFTFIYLKQFPAYFGSFCV